MRKVLKVMGDDEDESVSIVSMRATEMSNGTRMKFDSVSSSNYVPHACIRAARDAGIVSGLSEKIKR